MSELDNKRRAYELLSNVLQDAYQTDVLYFTHPYGDLTRIDKGIRGMMWTNYDQTSFHRTMPEDNRVSVVVIKSNLGFYNLILFLGYGKNPDFISIGPFRDEEISPHFFEKIVQDTNLPNTKVYMLKQYYEGMPIVSLSEIMNVTLHIMASFIPEFHTVTPEYIQYSAEKHEIVVNNDLLESYSTEYIEEYQKFLLSFLKTLKDGAIDESQNAMKRFLNHAKFSNLKTLASIRQMLHVINTYCHTALLDTTVHPNYTIQLAMSMNRKINSTVSETKLKYLPYDICHKYCLLVKNYAHPEYSRLTRDVMNYVGLHLEEELTLSKIADLFQKNASALSNSFSKETGTSLTQYIHQMKIQEALRLFNTTEMSVSDVAVAIGFQDFAYFSKIFRKVVGCSPRDYKNMGKISK